MNYKDFKILHNFFKGLEIQLINQSNQLFFTIFLSFFNSSFSNLSISSLDMITCLKNGFLVLNLFIFLNLFYTFFSFIKLTVYVFKFFCSFFAFYFRNCFLSPNKTFVVYFFHLYFSNSPQFLPSIIIYV